jgi:cyclopropane fatty-acyl-phospholipid synthase-like methyltransferase
MLDFYSDFYRAVQTSTAHASFCQRVFGLDLCQHGFADVGQLDALLAAASVRPNHRMLDIGCGNGLITEYLAERSGACVTGLDLVPEAIRQARERTYSKADQLAFCVGDINGLQLPPNCYDVIASIDSIYFSQNYTATIAALKQALRAGGRLAIYYSFGREPWVPAAEFPAARLPAYKTPLAEALKANSLSFVTLDFTADDYRLAVLRKAALAALRSQFEAEGNLFLYENRLGDAVGVTQAIQEGLHRRYLYIATPV